MGNDNESTTGANQGNSTTNTNAQPVETTVYVNVVNTSEGSYLKKSLDTSIGSTSIENLSAKKE